MGGLACGESARSHPSQQKQRGSAFSSCFQLIFSECSRKSSSITIAKTFSAYELSHKKEGAAMPTIAQCDPTSSIIFVNDTRMLDCTQGMKECTSPETAQIQLSCCDPLEPLVVAEMLRSRCYCKFRFLQLLRKQPHWNASAYLKIGFIPSLGNH